MQVLSPDRLAPQSPAASPALPDLALPDLLTGLGEPSGLSPRMSRAEARLLARLARDATRILEFGCGGSTLLLLQACEGLVLSVDSDAGWLARLAAEPAAATAREEGRLTLWHAAIGPTGAWGWPTGPVTADVAWRYWGAPWLMMPRADLILVDGRFRIACALAAHGRLAPGGCVAVHDYWTRPAYGEALAPFFDIT
ncbi:MAG: class I SAM-dependent methyltransferase, partial [Rhodovarius sp.]|nr:class I SAM-dependent methyltransferase [Rhodovarius sp.]MDW8314838.1 class I SAM-dependent methyltransferase [Rhodovarius sp.]